MLSFVMLGKEGLEWRSHFVGLTYLFRSKPVSLIQVMQYLVFGNQLYISEQKLETKQLLRAACIATKCKVRLN